MGKKLDLEGFFRPINVQNNPLIQIKKNIVRLLNELVKNKIIQNEVVILSKSGKKTQVDNKFHNFRYNKADQIYKTN